MFNDHEYNREAYGDPTFSPYHEQQAAVEEMNQAWQEEWDAMSPREKAMFEAETLRATEARDKQYAADIAAEDDLPF